MRVALLHNASAGSEDHDAVELSELIRRAGHEVVHRVTGVNDLTAALQHLPCDLVVVAGGDGTVGRAACELAGWRVPLSILPLGTANNTARTLKLPGRHKVLAKSWHRGLRMPFDLGLMGDGTVRRRFAEAVGWGVFPATIEVAKRQQAGKTVQQTLKRDRKLFRNAARETAPRDYRIELDGRDLSGQYVSVELMNVPLLGPRLAISPASDPGDGLFELVLVTEAKRGALEDLAKSGEVSGTPAWRIERGRQLSIETDDVLSHCDGRLWRHPAGRRRFEIVPQAGAVSYLR